MKKSMNLMTLKEIKAKFSSDEILDKIKSLTAEAEKYKNAVRFAANEYVSEVQADLYNLTITKIRKLESIVN